MKNFPIGAKTLAAAWETFETRYTNDDQSGPSDASSCSALPDCDTGRLHSRGVRSLQPRRCSPDSLAIFREPERCERLRMGSIACRRGTPARQQRHDFLVRSFFCDDSILHRLSAPHPRNLGNMASGRKKAAAEVSKDVWERVATDAGAPTFGRFRPGAPEGVTIPGLVGTAGGLIWKGVKSYRDFPENANNLGRRIRDIQKDVYGRE